MSDWSPPSIPRALVAAGAVAYLGLLAYGFVVAQQILLFGVLPAVAVLVAYVLWRFLAAIEGIADGAHRVADALEDAED